MLAEIIFGYKFSPAFIHFGVSEEFSFEVYDEGTVNYKKNIIGGKRFESKIIETKKIIIPMSVVEDIKKILIEQKNLIDKLPEEINNYSFDGSYDKFNFLGKKISCLNISRTSAEDYKKIELRWGKLSPYMNEIIQQQNSVLEIFESVYKILKNYGLKVYSWKNFSCDWKME